MSRLLVTVSMTEGDGLGLYSFVSQLCAVEYMKLFYQYVNNRSTDENESQNNVQSIVQIIFYLGQSLISEAGQIL